MLERLQLAVALALAFLCIQTQSFTSDSRSGRIAPTLPLFVKSDSSSQDPGSTAPSKPSFEVNSYQHKVTDTTYDITYRYQPASPKFKNAPPIILLYPVGIGLSAWFWEKTMAAFSNQGGPALYAVNLIGCVGVEPSWQGGPIAEQLPDLWVESIETLMKQIRSPQVNVFTQGALGPVGILLAHRNPQKVQNLILASPPVWKDLTVPTERDSIVKQWKFFGRSRGGKIFLKALETRRAVKLFSNLFLFEGKCDNLWLDRALEELDPRVRPAIVAVNAGQLTTKSLEEELTSLTQPTLLLVGKLDDKPRPRPEYKEKIPSCDFVLLPGRNVLPWESADDVVSCLLLSCYSNVEAQ